MIDRELRDNMCVVQMEYYQLFDKIRNLDYINLLDYNNMYFYEYITKFNDAELNNYKYVDIVIEKRNHQSSFLLCDKNTFCWR